jgi:hypothetical protein
MLNDLLNHMMEYIMVNTIHFPYITYSDIDEILTSWIHHTSEVLQWLLVEQFQILVLRTLESNIST